MSEIMCGCGAVLATYEFGVDPVPQVGPRCDACNSHVVRSVLRCGECGVEVGTIEIDDRNPPSPESVSAQRCRACMEDGA